MGSRKGPRAPGPWTELIVLTEKDGHTIASLARVAGLSKNYVAELARGDRIPNAVVIAKLADALRVPKSVLAPRYSDLHGGVAPTAAAS